MSSSWAESDSETFVRDAEGFVPDGELHIESICRRVSSQVESGLVVKLCCGDESLSEAILGSLEGIRILALDASDIVLIGLDWLV